MGVRYYFDTEFIENGPQEPIYLLSIGIVSEDGRHYYAELEDAPLHIANAWVKINVLPHLDGKRTKKRAVIRQEILEFVGDDDSPEFWAYYCAYDWVVFAQLFGTMADLPRHFPMFCRDFMQELASRGIDPQERPGHDDMAHHALADALWLKGAHEGVLRENG